MEQADDRHSKERQKVEKHVEEKKANFNKSIEELQERMKKVNAFN